MVMKAERGTAGEAGKEFGEKGKVRHKETSSGSVGGEGEGCFLQNLLSGPLVRAAVQKGSGQRDYNEQNQKVNG